MSNAGPAPSVTARSIQPTPTITGTDQIPGDAWVFAPGVIHYLDAVAPAVPIGFGLVPISNGFLGCWTHNTEKDLSGYVIRYSSPDVSGITRGHALRINAEVSDPNSWMQCARLGGFNDGDFITAQIAAYDASGNLSGFSDLFLALWYPKDDPPTEAMLKDPWFLLDLAGATATVLYIIYG